MKNLLISFALIMAFLVLIAFTADLPKTDLHVHLTANYANTTSLRYEKAKAAGAHFTFGSDQSTNPKPICHIIFLNLFYQNIECIGQNQKNQF